MDRALMPPWKKDSAFRTMLRRFRRTRLDPLKFVLAERRRRQLSSMKVVAITGSSGKTTATAILRDILRTRHKVVSNEFHNVLNTLARTIRTAPRDTEFAVFEVAAGNDPQVGRAAEIIRPDIAIVTMVEIEHFATYRTREAIAQEKGKLVEALSPDGIALLNADDDLVMAMATRTRGRTVTFGTGEGADYRAHDISSDLETGLRMLVSGPGRELEITAQLFGGHFYLPVLAAVAAALELGIAPEVVQKAVANYRGLIDRCGVLRIPDGPVFVLDTLKAPRHSMALPMDALRGIDAPRKTIVIGQISDYAGSSSKPYTEAAIHAAGIADRVFMVGAVAGKARFDEAAHGCEFRRFEEIADLALYLKKTAMPEEAILLKSGVNYHLERAALAFLGDVRCWPLQCGIGSHCFSCGLHSVPFHEQPSGARARRALAEKLGAREPEWTESGSRGRGDARGGNAGADGA